MLYKGGRYVTLQLVAKCDTWLPAVSERTSQKNKSRHDWSDSCAYFLGGKNLACPRAMMQVPLFSMCIGQCRMAP
jgi:hypothetical protein